MIKDRYLGRFSNPEDSHFYLALGSIITVGVLFFDDWKFDVHSAFVIGFTALMVWKSRKSKTQAG